VVCLATPAPYIAVGRWYEDFTQTSDQEVTELLRRAAKDLCAAATHKMH
jgi:predicted phosphoribosyltransferase